MAAVGTSTSTPFKVLVFSKTVAYRHDSIPAGIAAIQKLGHETGLFTVDASEDAEAYFTPEGLQPFSTLIFLSTSGNFLTAPQVDALKGFIRAGGGFVGIHCASFGILDHDWYGELVGARFDFHPTPQMGRISVENTTHFVCCAESWLGRLQEHGNDELTGSIEWFDEWYNFHSNPRDNATVLMTVEEGSYEGGTMGKDHPVAWCREFDGGRSLYTALGHFDTAFGDERFINQILRGILWSAKKEGSL
jgi:type 1 glutamine amidotransferase